ncbi:hypothetical protein OC845_005247 [Tilletia horrida]|nr:hypothetical protein OC845_005247 [Tilletia horrida]
MVELFYSSANHAAQLQLVYASSAAMNNSTAVKVPQPDDVEGFNIIITAAALGLIVLTLLWSLWLSHFRSVRLGDSELTTAPTTTFDLTKATIDEQKAAVEATVAQYRGNPLHPDSFKRAVRWRIRLLTFISLAMLCLNAFTLLSKGDLSTRPGFSLAIIFDIALWVLLLGITLRPLWTHEGWARLGQLSTLSTTSASTHVIRVLLPVSLATTGAGAQLRPAADLLQLVAIPISALAFVITLTIPSGPQRTFPVEPGKEKEIPMLRDQDSGASILTILYAGWCWPMMLKGKRDGFIGEDDCPVLGVSMRAAVLHAKMTLRNHKEKTLDANATSSQIAWKLLVSLFRTNDMLLIIVVATNIIGSALFYLPPFLLWKIVNIMETSEQSHEPRSDSFRRNFVYIVAFFFGQLLQIYTIGIASMTAMATLRNRIKAQLNTLLLSKALRRKDFSAPADKTPDASSAAEAAGEASDQAEGGDKNKKKKDKEEEVNIDIGSKSKVLALHTIDVQRVLELVNNFFFIVNSPVEVITGSILLYGLLGVGGFVGLATAVIPIPIVYYLSKLQTKLQDQLMSARDERTAALNESLQAIRMVKLGAWEDRISERVNVPRRKELKRMRVLFVLETLTRLIGELSPILIVMSAFAWSTLVEGRVLTPGIAFASFAVLKELKWSIQGVPQVITESLQCFVSLRRVAVYLQSPEVEAPPRTQLDQTDLNEAAVPVALHDALVGWPVFAGVGAKETALPSPFCLRDVSIEFEANELNLICGRLGSGKTLLLLSLLGEAELLAGRISCPRSPADAIVQSDHIHILAPGKWISPDMVAFAPQQAVILNGSIQYNILWGLPMNRERYDATIAACGLLPDLKAFEDGDSTEIGEGGIGLSGGQKARVGLARAVYSRAQTLLLDDILSAVDAHTAAHIHKRLLKGPLLKGRTVLLVSHQVQLVAPSASLVVVLDDGRVQFQGISAKFLASEHYSGLVDGNKGVITVEETEEIESDARVAEDKDIKDVDATKSNGHASGSDPKDSATNTEATPTKDPETARKLVEEEKREKGAINSKVWAAYFKAAGGPPVVIPAAAAILISELWQIVPAAWLAVFTSDTTRPGGMTHTLVWWLSGYIGLSVAGALISGLRYGLLFFVSYVACTHLFEDALRALYRAPIRFHDTTPRGRIVNRFGSDVQSVDEQFIHSLTWMSSRVVAFLLSLVIVCVEGSPLFLALVVLLAPAYNWVATCFRTVIRDARRIGQTTKSPVAQTFTDVLSGLAVIRAFGSVETTLRTFFARHDHNVRFENLQMHRWSSTMMSSFSAFQLFIASCFIASNDGTSAATAALALSFLLDIGSQLQQIVGATGQLEFCLVAVERLAEFAQTKPEAAEIVEPRPPANWPQTGAVEFKNIRVRYAPELPDVLKDVNFKIAGGSKVGIVGPTGCGKSTTVTSLFRFVEYSGGSVEIDGIDISKIGLKDLRSRIQIVPQDPVILSGTLRDAIDVFHDRTDADILEALRKVRLIRDTPVASPRLDGTNGTAANGGANGQAADGNAEETNKNVFEDLSYKIAEGGSNLSNGQRQLLCMARALLGQAKLIVFDEASSSVDTDTDALITATLQQEFKDCTVITIAHRLRTIMHSDQVIVMDKGSVAEMASPAELMHRPESHFYKLCSASGLSEFEKLKEMANGGTEVTG